MRNFYVTGYWTSIKHSCVALLYCCSSVDSWLSIVDGSSERTSEWHNRSYI